MPSSSRKEAVEDLVARVEAEQVRHVDLQYTDVIGGVKTVTIPASQLGVAIAHGTWFDGSSVELFARTAELDMYLVPDPSTFQILPWGSERTARLICWTTTPDGEPYAGDPRGVLRRAIEDAARLGFEYRVGPEVEFFLLERGADGSLAPPRNDRSSYFDFSSDGNTDLRQRMVSAILSMGIAVNTSHHEIAGGQHEIDIDASSALKAADDLFTFRYALKAVAQQSGAIATFMPKPFDGQPGSGMHIHQSLLQGRDAGNAFAGDDAYGLSDVAQHFIAGQLHHARGDERRARAAGEFLQAPGAGLRGADFHLVGAHEPGRAHPRPARRPRRGDARRAAQPRSVVQPLPRVRGDAPLRPRRHRAPAPAPGRRSRSRSTGSTSSSSSVAMSASCPTTSRTRSMRSRPTRW